MLRSLSKRFCCFWNQFARCGGRISLILSMLVFAIVLFFLLSTLSYALDVTLVWDAGYPNDNLLGYMLHYKEGAPGPPYDGTEANEGESPIDIGLSTTFTLTGLDETETYFFRLTAYNDDAESGYSNEVCVNCPTKTNMQNGGGDGGCFIATAASGSAMESHLVSLKMRFLMPPHFIILLRKHL